ncbi:Endonuclease/exonuclease/phosphatase [Aspergillus unguis]
MNSQQKAQLVPDEPNLQTFYHFDQTADPPQWRPSTETPTPPAQTDQIHLLSWNIDFSTSAGPQRMTAALQYLYTLLTEHEKNDGAPTVMLLQEMVDSDLTVIQQTSWVQERFYITDISDSHFGVSYETTTLVDRRLPPQRVFRVPYSRSCMDRDALFVDVKVNDRTVRICNTHLESLAVGMRMRPVQLKLASEFMHGTNSNPDGREEIQLPKPHAAILAGDLNAFAPEDRLAPGECGLQDAFLTLGGKEDTEEGYTWGYQNPPWALGKFPPSRMDKVLLCGGLETKSFELIGKGLKTTIEFYHSDYEEEDSSDSDEDIWITDHFGLEAHFRVVP